MARKVNVDAMKGARARPRDRARERPSDSDWRGFLRRCVEVLDEIDDLPERAEDFAEGVRGRVEDMRAWVEEHEHVTERMETTLSNISDGVARWSR